MKTRIIVAAIGLPVLLAVLIFLPPIVLALLLSVMCAIGALEMRRAVKEPREKRPFFVTAGFAAITPIVIFLIKDSSAFFAIIMPLLAYNFAEGIIAYEKEEKVSLEAMLYSLLSGALIPFFLSTMLLLKMMEKGAYLTILVCVITMISDSGAYFTGVYLGKRKITPHVSPNKSLEGYIGSMVSSIVGVLLFGVVAHLIGDFDVSLLRLLVYGIIGNLFTQLGDLSFSLIKRICGIKDYGNLLPGHGGILDRFDSMIFTAPVVYLLVTLFPAF